MNTHGDRPSFPADLILPPTGADAAMPAQQAAGIEPEAETPRLVIRGESQTTDTSSNEGERLVLVKRGRHVSFVAIPLPISAGAPFAALTDYLNCTFSCAATSLDPYVFAFDLTEFLGESSAPAIDRGRGLHGYGSRPMFRCPCCAKKCAVVYFGGNTFACRKCLKLVYISEGQDPMGRLWSKQRKIESRLIDGDMHYQKPKGTHWRTFNRLADKIDEIEQQKDAVFLICAGALLARMGLKPEEL